MVGVLLWGLTAEFHQVLRADPGSLIEKKSAAALSHSRAAYEEMTADY